jgi:hypothetical protein
MRILFPTISEVPSIDKLLGERLLFLLLIEGNNSIGTPLIVSLILLEGYVNAYLLAPRILYVSSQTSHSIASRASCY